MIPSQSVSGAKWDPSLVDKGKQEFWEEQEKLFKEVDQRERSQFTTVLSAFLPTQRVCLSSPSSPAAFSPSPPTHGHQLQLWENLLSLAQRTNCLEPFYPRCGFSEHKWCKRQVIKTLKLLSYLKAFFRGLEAKLVPKTNPCSWWDENRPHTVQQGSMWWRRGSGGNCSPLSQRLLRVTYPHSIQEEAGWSIPLHQLTVFEDETHIVCGISLKSTNSSMKSWNKMGFINDKVPSSFWHLAIAETLARLKNWQYFNRIKKTEWADRSVKTWGLWKLPFHYERSRIHRVPNTLAITSKCYHRCGEKVTFSYSYT